MRLIDYGKNMSDPELDSLTVGQIADEIAALARADAWPCANYTAPVTCLTAPSSGTGRCDWCRDQAAAARAEGGRAALLQAANDTTTNGPKVELYVPIHESIALWLRDRAAALRAATEDPS
jgi:hypothetical protein